MTPKAVLAVALYMAVLVVWFLAVVGWEAWRALNRRHPKPPKSERI